MCLAIPMQVDSIDGFLARCSTKGVSREVNLFLLQDREVSVGDYVLSGGEIAAMTLIDACVRLLPGVMGAAESGHDESFSDGLLEYPQYTRPQVFEGRAIPDILVSGDHARIGAWRQAEAEALTKSRRPDLWATKTARNTPTRPPKNTTKG